MWFDEVILQPEIEEIFLDFLKSPAAVELMNAIIYNFGDTIVWKEIPIDSEEAQLCFIAFNIGLIAAMSYTRVSDG